MRLAHSTSAPKCESNFTAHLNWANSMPLQHATYWLIPTQVGDRTVAHVVAEAHYTKKGVRELRLEIVWCTVSSHGAAGTCCDQVMSRSVMPRMLFSFRLVRGSTSTRDCHGLPLGSALRVDSKIPPPGPHLNKGESRKGGHQTWFAVTLDAECVSPLVHSESRLQVTIMIL